MKKLLGYAFLLTGLLSSACTTHKIDVQQGNIITSDMIEQINVGMTKRQVEFILGNPLLIDSFNSNRWIYYYRLQPGNGEIEQYHITLDFKDDKLSHIESTLSQPPDTDAPALVD